MIDDERRRLRELLGIAGLGTRAGGTQLGRAVHAGHVVERWRLELNAFEPVPALLSLPADREPVGLVLYHHAHGHRFEVGKSELVDGRPSLECGPYAAVLAEHGFAALAIDHWGFGERAHTTERMLFKRWLWHGRSLLGLRILDALAALDWLDTHPALRSLPRVAYGISMGGTLAWWSAALDARIDGVVDECCLCEFEPLLASGGYDLHAEYFFVPGLLPAFTATRINALIAPRPHLSLAGRTDPLTPEAGLEAIDRGLRAAYASSPDRWRQSVHPGGHAETAAMRAEVLAFLDEAAGGGWS
jgi:dienelactone hydrolase